MNYIEVKIIPTPYSEAVCDLLSAQLGPLGFDSFSTEADCLKAYITENLWDSEALNQSLADFPIPDVELPWVAQVVEMQDWNQEWEQSQQFEPIVVGEKCCVHSPAAPAELIPQCQYDIIIDPKMSFGSGTHETTSQLLEEILSLPLNTSESSTALNSPVSLNTQHTTLNSEPKALDMGTGTGVLGILCALRGYQVRAIEIDDWVAANAVDNVLYNGLAGQMQVECGDASLLTEGPTYSLVLANINRNVLLADMAQYQQVMLPGATLLMSGFYEEDVPAIRQCAEALGLKYVSHRSRNNWVVIRFRKD